MRECLDCPLGSEYQPAEFAVGIAPDALLAEQVSESVYALFFEFVL